MEQTQQGKMKGFQDLTAAQEALLLEISAADRTSTNTVVVQVFSECVPQDQNYISDNERKVRDQCRK